MGMGMRFPCLKFHLFQSLLQALFIGYFRSKKRKRKTARETRELEEGGGNMGGNQSTEIYRGQE